MKYLLLVLIALFTVGCGDVRNANPLSPTTSILKSNSVDDNIVWGGRPDTINQIGGDDSVWDLGPGTR